MARRFDRLNFIISLFAVHYLPEVAVYRRKLLKQERAQAVPLYFKVYRWYFSSEGIIDEGSRPFPSFLPSRFQRNVGLSL